MTEAIDIDKIRSVLIGTTWHDVAHQTFTATIYRYEADGQPFTLGENGFSFRSSDSGETIAGPITSITAVAYNE